MLRRCLLLIFILVLYTDEEVSGTTTMSSIEQQKLENSWCLYGGDYDEDTQMCYMLMKYDNFYEAQSTCRTLFDGGFLPCTYNYIISQFPSDFQCSSTIFIWLGLLPNGTCPYNNALGQTRPSTGDNSSCTAMMYDGTQIEYNCTFNLPYFCGYPPVTEYCDTGFTFFEYTKMCYKLTIFDEAIKFIDSTYYCENQESLAVSIYDQTENNFVLLLAQSQPIQTTHMWIGLYAYLGDFYWWPDSIDAPYLNLDVNISTLDDSGNYCGAMWTTPKDLRMGKWSAMDCNVTLPAIICKKASSLTPTTTPDYDSLIL